MKLKIKSYTLHRTRWSKRGLNSPVFWLHIIGWQFNCISCILVDSHDKKISIFCKFCHRLFYRIFKFIGGSKTNQASDQNFPIRFSTKRRLHHTVIAFSRRNQAGYITICKPLSALLKIERVYSPDSNSFTRNKYIFGIYIIKLSGKIFSIGVLVKWLTINWRHVRLLCLGYRCWVQLQNLLSPICEILPNLI